MQVNLVQRLHLKYLHQPSNNLLSSTFPPPPFHQPFLTKRHHHENHHRSHARSRQPHCICTLWQNRLIRLSCGYSHRDSALPLNRMIKEIWSGRAGLAKIYWVYGILVGLFLWAPILTFLTPGSPTAIMTMAVLHAYQIIITVGIWRAASQYQGRAIWAILAKIAAAINFLVIAIITLALISALVDKTPTKPQRGQHHKTTPGGIDWNEIDPEGLFDFSSLEEKYFDRKDLDTITRWRYDNCVNSASDKPTEQGVRAALHVCTEKFLRNTN